MTVSRAGAVYGAHAYHTKIPAEAIEPHLLRYSEPGELVLDPFCGSGMTGVAAARLGRRAWLADLSPAAVHIARNYTMTCEPSAYSLAATSVVTNCGVTHDRLYGSRCHVCGGPSHVAYVIWSDVRACVKCGVDLRVWDQRTTGLRHLTCPSCKTSFRKSQGRFVREEPVRVNLHCSSCGRIERDPRAEDIAAANVERSGIETWYPRVPFDSGREMWRQGHAELGVTEVADFYSPRNLWALSQIWTEIQKQSDARMREALMFTFTAIANRASRRYQWNAKRPTNVLGGTLYIASLRYEFNVFDLWRRKAAAIKKLFEVTNRSTVGVEVHLGSATDLPLPDDSVDYVFTDPPFGANIVYSDCSLLWESWLSALTDRGAEAIVTRHLSSENGGKGVDGYRQLMLQAFKEIRRVLKPERFATLVFQNTDPVVWEAILGALGEADLIVEEAATLHKTQPSFKGVKAQLDGERVAATDIVLTLRRGPHASPANGSGTWAAIDDALRSELTRASGAGGRMRSTGHLYAIALAAAISNELSVRDVSFSRIETWLGEHCDYDNGWRLKKETVARPMEISSALQ